MAFELKRYIVFAGSHYYPLGGWGDFVESTGDFESARKLAEQQRKENKTDWEQIVDTQTGHIFKLERA